jgi:ABC-type bacteriocin/lantibiotic exporters, contain an N-terminal double-glycine peptidase domain
MRLPKYARLCAGVALSLSLLGCAGTPQLAALRENPGALPPRAELSSVPFFPQETHQCGPASLAMAANFAGVATSAEALTAQTYLPDREGSLQAEMMAAARRQGLLAYPLAPSLGDLFREVAAGAPVIVLQNLSLAAFPKWHYAVVIGYELGREEIILRSGLERRQVLSFRTFEHTWARSGYWAMLALPPKRLPATANESRYVSAALALEQTSQSRSAQAAYQTALSRWPRNLTARMGLGNTAYAAGDTTLAEAAFRQAAADHPREWMPLNNLAHVLADQQRYADALSAASQAAAMAGMENPIAQKTLREIQSRAAHR